MTTNSKPFDVAGFFELTAKQAQEEMPLLEIQAKWFRLQADLIEQHKSMNDVAAALVALLGVDGQERMGIQFDIDQHFAKAMMKMKTLVAALETHIAEQPTQKHQRKK